MEKGAREDAALPLAREAGSVCVLQAVTGYYRL